MKFCVSVYFIIAACAFLCGCETVGAFGTGRITKEDVAYIAHAGTLGKTTTPVNVDSPDAEEEEAARLDSGELRSKPLPKISKADAWLEDNLW